jgi:hypothetical protein
MSASWIVKPVTDLSPAEREQWHSIRFSRIPLSQTLAWAAAAESVSGNCILVFSPERKISALYLITGDQAECVNGPVLNWEHIRSPEDLNEQISMSVFALYQGCPWLQTIRIRPRLNQKNFLYLAKSSAFPIIQTDLAQTMLIELDDSKEKMWDHLPARIRHEIHRARSSGVTTETLDLEHDLTQFWEKTREFYQSRGLFVPEEEWIRSLLYTHTSTGCDSAQIIRASHPASGSISEILVLHTHDVSYYFYAHENRNESCPNISLNICAQWEAIQTAATLGATYYDLNGLLHPEHRSSENETYLGVDHYKRKFKGKEIEYFSPLITFSNRE